MQAWISYNFHQDVDPCICVLRIQTRYLYMCISNMSRQHGYGVDLDMNDHSLIQLGHLLNYKKEEEIVVEVREGMQAYENTLSARQMDSLNALCDTLWPSLSPPTHHNILNESSDLLLTYYRTSASMAGTPQRLGGLLCQRLRHPALFLLRLALWLLSTWFGTFLLCGVLSLSSEFPYLQSFSKVSQKKREKIMRGWSSSSLYLLRMLFQSIKMLVLLVFFTQLNDRHENPSWKAIDYPGPDPDFPYSKTPHPQDDEEEGIMEDTLGPLCRGIVDLTHSKDTVATTLRNHGFSVDSDETTIFCDVVVVGSGSGGGVAAGILAKAGYKVVVLEKGDYFARSTLSLLEGPTMDQMYHGSGFLATADLGVLILAGSTVGGGSTINWSASIKTPKHVMKEWCEKQGLELFGSALYQEAMEAVCERMGVQSGILEEGFNNCVLRRGCEELGYPVSNIPRNTPPDHYCGWCCLGCKDGRKQGTAETWLVDAVESGNALILPNCNALKVVYSEAIKRKQKTRAATGVVFEHDGGYKQGKQSYTVKSRVTVVAAGALGTPALLKRSGLRNPNIGKHLHLHPVAMAWGYFPDQEGEKKSFEGGIMTAMSTVVGEFEGSGYGAVIQTPALHPGMFSALTPWVSAEDMRERMRRFSRTAHVFALARDEGEGEVEVTSNTNNNWVSVIRYQVSERDEEKLRRGVERCLRILAAAGAEEVGTQHREGRRLSVRRASSHEFERFVREESGRGVVRGLNGPACSAHQMGSCRMGREERGSVVDERGETWEVEGLFLADASVFPTALGVNPMVTVQAIAYCTAHSVLELLKRKKKRDNN